MTTTATATEPLESDGAPLARPPEAASAPRPPVSENPYLAARREWNERYGDYIAQARTWRLVALVALLITLVAVVGVVSIGSQNQLVPYVVAVDKLGQAVAVRRADRTQATDPQVIRAMLAAWIVKARSVMVDASVQKRAILEVYALLRSGDAAQAMLNAYYQGGQSPFERAKTETVTVEIESVLPLSEKTWHITWREVRRGRDGLELERLRMQAAATLTLIPPTDEATILKNPIGLYITELSWSKQL